ncbi:hypothetical protein JCM8202v2_004554 [Rhodotorula sphaerocarpa]
MTVNYMGGSRHAHARQPRKSQLDATGAPAYSTSSSNANRAASAHLGSLRKRLPPHATGSRIALASGLAANIKTPRPTFDFHFVNKRAQGTKRSPSEIGSRALLREDRRRLLLTTKWEMPQPPPPPPPPRTLPRPSPAWVSSSRVRESGLVAPASSYVPLASPPPGGFFPGSALAEGMNGNNSPAEEDQILDYSSEPEDAVSPVTKELPLLYRDELEPPPQPLDGSRQTSGLNRDFSSDTPCGPASPPNATHSYSTNLSTTHSSWSGSSKSTHGSARATPRILSSLSPPSAGSGCLHTDVTPHDLPSVEHLSLQTPEVEPIEAPPESLLKEVSDHSLEIVDFSQPRPSTARATSIAADLGRARNVASSSESPRGDSRDSTKSPRLLGQPDEALHASHPEPVQVEAGISAPDRSDPIEAPLRPPDLDLDALARARHFTPPAASHLPPLHYLARIRSFENSPLAAVEPDDVRWPYSAHAHAQDVLLVSERMGLGCDALTSQQADRLVRQEFILRQCGVPPLEWAWKDSEGEEEDGRAEEADGHEGWSPDELERMVTSAPAPTRRLAAGELFHSSDLSGILET